MSVILIKNGTLYTPQPVKERDILAVNEKIVKIADVVPEKIVHSLFQNSRIIDASDSIIVPGFVDPHIHINGAGGEGGPQFRTPPVQLSTLIRSGITSAVGLLGTDGSTRSLRDLLMKARGLGNEGIDTWIYTGSYQVPPPTITGSIMSDIVLMDRVIGVKISLSDHRSSHPTVEELRRIASEARVGGILSGKAGVVHVHMGTETPALLPLLKAVEHTDIPIGQFIPTHINRSKRLLEQAIEFGKSGGYLDITTGSSSDRQIGPLLKPSRAVKNLLQNGVPLERITMSTDGNGSMPRFNEKKELVRVSIAPVSTLYREFKDMINEEKIPIEDAVKVVSTNSALHLKLLKKGEIKVDKDCDLLLMDKRSLELKYVISNGQILMDEGKTVKHGTFEE